VHRHGEPIDDVPVRQTVNTGIAIQSNNGFVPEYEEREAAVFALIPWSEWDSLSWYERAAAVAHYRMHQTIETHVNDAVESERRRKERK
jgi:hypothetical protein